jgi:methenyltetrahydromethanopterin cyclohydrolase
VIEYEDDFDYAVIALESDHLPNWGMHGKNCPECNVDVANVCAVVVQRHRLWVSSGFGRCVETAIYKLNEWDSIQENYFRNRTAPVPPVKKDAQKRWNDE